MLRLHLAPDRIDALEARLRLESKPHVGQPLAYRAKEIVGHDIAAPGALAYQVGNVGVGRGVLIFEAEVFELGLYSEEAEPVGQRSVDIERFAGNLILLVGGHGA